MTGVAYFIRRGDRIKIGLSTQPVVRARQLRGELLCTIAGGAAMERALHDLFADDRLNGEWFRPSAAVLAFIADPQPPAALDEIPTPGRPAGHGLDLVAFDAANAGDLSNAELARLSGLSRPTISNLIHGKQRASTGAAAALATALKVEPYVLFPTMVAA